ncbi:peroxiredoxin [Salsuginibacillus halophilus]|uniref:Peroxiredoxin n=1 Tax=Salsuginibacillus halophilus TaxID=517424 RepID=A0A2P8HAM4_9BACI|nr:redoxin domain-containing protein [Salsuginibacillus halophilus]PSL43219.1 peroxiredoxin [Salsuginibacillus halophilus]
MNLKNILIGLLLAGMLSWTLIDAIDWGTEESTEQESGGAGDLAPVPEGEIGLDEGDYAPDFTLETLAGEEMSLYDVRGEKKVMLNFWATWCPPCRAEMPDMQEVYEEQDGIEIIAVNLTDSEPGVGQVEDFADDYGLTFPILLDHDVDVATNYDIQPVPTSYFIDTEGRVQHVALGAVNQAFMLQQFNDMD